jgi:hypothetical protein
MNTGGNALSFSFPLSRLAELVNQDPQLQHWYVGLNPKDTDPDPQVFLLCPFLRTTNDSLYHVCSGKSFGYNFQDLLALPVEDQHDALMIGKLLKPIGLVRGIPKIIEGEVQSIAEFLAHEKDLKNPEKFKLAKDILPVIETLNAPNALYRTYFSGSGVSNTPYAAVATDAEGKPIKAYLATDITSLNQQCLTHREASPLTVDSVQLLNLLDEMDVEFRRGKEIGDAPVAQPRLR